MRYRREQIMPKPTWHHVGVPDHTPKKLKIKDPIPTPPQATELKLWVAAQDLARKLGKLTDKLNHFGFVWAGPRGGVKSNKYINAPCYMQVPSYHPCDKHGYDSYGYPKKIGGGDPAHYFVDNALAKAKKKYGHPFYETAPAIFREYIDWVINHSVFATAHAEKDVEFVMNHSAILNCNHSPQFTIAAAMAIRYVAEYPERVDIWHALKKKTSPEFALLLSDWTNMSFRRGDNKIKVWIKSKYAGGNHSIFQLGMHQQGLRRYLAGDRSIDKSRKSFAYDANYKGLHRPWYDEDKDGNGINIYWPETSKIKYTDGFGRERKRDSWNGKQITAWIKKFAALNDLEDVLNVNS